MDRVLLPVVIIMALFVAGTDTTCLEDEYFNPPTGTCHPCSICRPGQVRWIRCSDTMDTVCGPPPDFLNNSDQTKLDQPISPELTVDHRTDFSGVKMVDNSFRLSTVVIISCSIVLVILSMVAGTLAVCYYCSYGKGRDPEYGPVVNV